jgi:hypothetical protein
MTDDTEHADDCPRCRELEAFVMHLAEKLAICAEILGRRAERKDEHG